MKIVDEMSKESGVLRKPALFYVLIKIFTLQKYYIILSYFGPYFSSIDQLLQ
jgi:hypothetical protein